MDFSCYLFDLDGTLVDTTEGVIKCIDHALKHFGLPIEDTVPFGYYMRPPLFESFTKFAGLSEQDARTAIEIYRERYDTLGKKECFVPDGIEEILQGLCGQGKQLAVSTSKLETAAVEVLERFGLAKYFATVSGSDPEEKVSSKEAVIEQALDRLGVTDKSRVLMIGDRKYDILGAKKCGIRSLGLYAGAAEPGEMENAGADYVAHSVAEMKSLLL
ncbi:MAG: HAD-IA family hydrolase [Clostridiales bacterium]|nr:HAD-IA family hydrolase [Candidatus Coliplasma caballi]